jgi:hypothetical protein
MDFSMTRTATETFTLTHAKKLASKVAADMKRCQSIYGYPSDAEINNFGTELALLLRDGYVSEYEFGYLKDGARHLVWHYRVDTSGDLADSRPGGIVHVSITGCTPYNRLTRSNKWHALPLAERQKIEADLPVDRTPTQGPPDGHGYWTSDRNYSAGGVSLPRKTFQPYL